MNDPEFKRLDKSANVGCLMSIVSIVFVIISACVAAFIKLKDKMQPQWLTVALVVFGLLTIIGGLKFSIAVYTQDLMLLKETHLRSSNKKR